MTIYTTREHGFGAVQDEHEEKALALRDVLERRGFEFVPYREETR